MQYTPVAGAAKGTRNPRIQHSNDVNSSFAESENLGNLASAGLFEPWLLSRCFNLEVVRSGGCCREPDI